MALTEEFAIVSLAEAELELRGYADADSGLLLSLVLQCTEEIETICDRLFVSRGTRTEYHTFRRESQNLYLRQQPIISITSVHEDSTRQYGSDALLTTSTDFVEDTEGGKLVRVNGDVEVAWLTGYEAIKVVGTLGYTQDNVPGDVKRVALEWIARKWNEITGHSQGDASVQDGLGSRSFFGPADFTSHMRERLLRHKLYQIEGGTTFSRAA